MLYDSVSGGMNMSYNAFLGRLPIVDAAISIWTETGDGTSLVQDWHGDDSYVNLIVGISEADVASFMTRVKSRGNEITKIFRHQTEIECWVVMIKPML